MTKNNGSLESKWPPSDNTIQRPLKIYVHKANNTDYHCPAFKQEPLNHFREICPGALICEGLMLLCLVQREHHLLMYTLCITKRATQVGKGYTGPLQKCNKHLTKPAFVVHILLLQPPFFL